MQAVNFKNIKSYHTLADAHNILCHSMSDHHMRVGAVNSFEMQFFHQALGPLSLNFLTFNHDINIEITDCGDDYFIIFPQYTTDNKQTQPSTILSPGNAYSMLIKRDIPLRIIKISASFIDRQLTELMAYSITRSVIFSPEMICEQGKNASWHRYVDYLFHEVVQQDNMFNNDSTNIELAKVIVAGLLNGQDHTYSEELSARSSTVVPGPVFRAEKYIKKHIYQDISIDDIVGAAKVRKRTLYDAFRRFRGISPICYLQNLRLDMAREEFLQTNNDIKVTFVASKLGFNHLGRFSIYYKKRFGESPSQTLQKRH